MPQQGFAGRPCGLSVGHLWVLPCTTVCDTQPPKQERVLHLCLEASSAALRRAVVDGNGLVQDVDIEQQWHPWSNAEEIKLLRRRHRPPLPHPCLGNLERHRFATQARILVSRAPIPALALGGAVAHPAPAALFERPRFRLGPPAAAAGELQRDREAPPDILDIGHGGAGALPSFQEALQSFVPLPDPLGQVPAVDEVHVAR